MGFFFHNQLRNSLQGSHIIGFMMARDEHKISSPIYKNRGYFIHSCSYKAKISLVS